MCINILPQYLAPVFSCPAVLDRSSIKGFIQVSPDYGCRLWHRETIFYLFFCSTQSFTVCAAVFGWCKFGCLPGEDARPHLALWRLTCKEIERERKKQKEYIRHTQDRLLTFPSGNGGVFRFNECCHTKMEVLGLGLWGQHPLMKCRRVKKQFARLLCSEWQQVESLFFALSPASCHRNSLNHWKTEPLTATRAPEPSREHIGTKQNSTDCAEKGLLSLRCVSGTCFESIVSSCHPCRKVKRPLVYKCAYFKSEILHYQSQHSDARALPNLSDAAGFSVGDWVSFRAGSRSCL